MIPIRTLSRGAIARNFSSTNSIWAAQGGAGRGAGGGDAGAGAKASNQAKSNKSPYRREDGPDASDGGASATSKDSKQTGAGQDGAVSNRRKKARQAREQGTNAHANADSNSKSGAKTDKSAVKENPTPKPKVKRAAESAAGAPKEPARTAKANATPLQPVEGPTTLALSSFDSLFRESRFAAVDASLATRQVFGIPAPAADAEDAEWEEFDKRRERGAFGFKEDFGAYVPTKVFTPPRPVNRRQAFFQRNQAPVSPNPADHGLPDFLPTPRFITPRAAAFSYTAKVARSADADFDQSGERSSGWQPAVGDIDTMTRWNETVPAESAAKLAGPDGPYRAVRWDPMERKSLAELPNDRFEQLLHVARQPATHTKFAAWIRAGMPPLDNWKGPAKSSHADTPLVADIPPGAASEFVSSLLQTAGAASSSSLSNEGSEVAQVHGPSYLYHLQDAQADGTLAIDDAALNATPNIRALMDPETLKAKITVKGRVLNSLDDGERIAAGVAGFVASAPMPSWGASGGSLVNRSKLVEFELLRAFWKDADTHVMEVVQSEVSSWAKRSREVGAGGDGAKNWSGASGAGSGADQKVKLNDRLKNWLEDSGVQYPAEKRGGGNRQKKF